jgi:hypothetical protein
MVGGPMSNPPMTQPMPGAGPQLATPEARKKLLEQWLFHITARGGQVVTREEFTAVVQIGQPINNVLHVLLTIFLCGLWLLVWIPMIIWGGPKRYVIAVDESGRVFQNRTK